MKRPQLLPLLILCSSLVAALAAFVLPATAQTTILTIEPLTWNVVGLDSNDVTVGPNTFPVGARVCNTSATETVTNLTSTFVWDDGDDTYIHLRPGTLSEFTGTNAVPSLGPGDCYDFYYEVEVTRDSDAYDQTRSYHITASADSQGTISTPQPRELYVEFLISQSRNSITDVQLDSQSVPAGGTMVLTLGQTYTIDVIGSTATNGYNQIESFINLPNTIFEVLSVETSYSADTSPYVDNPSDKLYGDGCLWDNDPNSPTYRACTGVDGKAGGNITVSYDIKIIGGAGTTETLNTLIYDFSGSSYHYNSDYSVEGRIVAIIDPSQITISKQFTPNPISAGGISRLTFTIQNPNDVAVSGLNFSDTFPTSPGAMVVANSPNPTTSGCGSPTFSPVAGAASISFSGGTVGANSSCTVSLNVSAPAVGDYDNVSGNLFVDTIDTGNSASDTLTVTDAPLPPEPVCDLIMAQWNFTGMVDPPPQPSPSTKATDVGTAAISVGGLTAEADNTLGNPAPSYLTYGWPRNGPVDTATFPFIQFAIDTSEYSQVELSIDVRSKSNGPDSNELYYSTNGTTWSLKQTFTSTPTWATFGPYDFTGQTNTSGMTYFRLYGYGANTTRRGADLNIDNVTFTGCGVPEPPTLTKSFTPDPVAVGASTTLSFTVTNPNPALALSDIEFTDTLPTGLTVATSSTPACGGTLASTAPDSISFSGGSLAADGVCNFSIPVTVTTAGPHENISGFISAAESGENNTATGSASATVTGLLPPSIAKQFAPNPILTGQTSTLTFTLSNPNLDDELTGVAFTDTFPTSPGNMVVANPTGATTSGCGSPTFSPVAGAGSISFSDGTIAAGGSCTVSVDVTATAIGDYANTSGNVSAAIVGNGNSASDTLTVQPVHPRVSILKQVSTSSTGPWRTFVAVTEGSDVYFQMTVENTGDVPLTNVNVTDPTLSGLSLDLSGCSWGSFALFEVQTCVVGPVSATSGSNDNTATAHADYNSTTYDSEPSTATYATTGLTLVKSVAESSFTSAGDVLNYSFEVTNSGSAPLAGPVSVSDDKADDESCPAVSTVGDNDNFLDPGESITCSASYEVDGADVSAGSVTNTASAQADGVTSNTDDETVFINQPELRLAKANDTSDSILLGDTFDWSITVSNVGPADASFSSGQTILSDPLPSGPSYGSPSVGSLVNVTGSANISCSIDGSDLLTCAASGGSVVVGGTNGAFTVSLSVTPATVGNLPNTGTVDPDDVITEITEDNNTGSDTVAVSAPELSANKSNDAGGSLSLGDPFDWTIAVANGTGSNIATATFASGEVILRDDLPSGPSYGSVSVTDGGTAPGGTGSINCAIVSEVLTCRATGGTVTLSAGASFEVSFSVTPASAGSLVNPASGPGDVCQVDPDNLFAETNEADNNCSDTVTAIAPPTIAKSFAEGSIPVDGSTTLQFTLTNPNAGDGLTGVAFSDNLPAGLTVTSSTSSQCGGTLTVTAPASIALSGATLAADDSCTFDVTVTGSSAGDKNNTTSVVTSTEGGEGGTASDSIIVVAPPSISKAFSPLEINLGDISTLTFTLTNPPANSVPLTGVAFSDDYPAGLENASPPNDANSCGGSLTAVAGAASLALTGGTIPVDSSCSISVDVIGTSVGDKLNLSDYVTSSNGGQGNRASDALTVSDLSVIDPAVTKAVDPSEAQVGDPVTFTLTVFNEGGGDAADVVVTDQIPAFLDIISVDVDPGGPTVDISGNLITIDFDTLAFDDVYTVTIETVVNEDGQPRGGTNQVELTTSSDDDDPDNNTDSVEVDLIVLGSVSAPETGFAPSRPTRLPEQPASLSYTEYQGLWLEIPSQGIEMEIVGVPLGVDGWDVTWLSDQAGYLAGTAFPTWRGNSVITGHAVMPSGLPGAFAVLPKLQYGDQVVIHAWGASYHYEIRESDVLRPSDASIFRHEEQSWLTLLTCQEYDRWSESYLRRRVVRAVLMKIEGEGE